MSHSNIASEREITARAINSVAHTPDARLRGRYYTDHLAKQFDIGTDFHHAHFDFVLEAKA